MEDLASRLSHEHEQLRGRTVALAGHLQAGEAHSAVAALDVLALNFRRLVREQEERVLRVLEPMSGVGAVSRASAVRSEHRVLLDLLSVIERSVTAGDLAVAHIDLREWLATLDVHMKRERSLAKRLDAKRVRAKG